MINNIRKGIRSIKQGRINFLLFGILYYFISLKNKLIEKIKYIIIKRKRNGNRFYKTIINNSLMYLDTKREDISKELAVNKKRERFTTNFIKKIIKKGDTIIDIGANIGYYVLLESRLAKRGKIYAIEPIPQNRELLKKNIKLNNYRNIFVFDYAIGDKNGKGEMYVYDKGNWCSFVKNLNSKIIETKSVDILAIDHFIKKHVKKVPSLIRMDVEGYEHKIIRGMKRTLEKRTPMEILIELHPPWLNLISRDKMEEMINELKKNEFRVKAIFLEVTPYNYKSLKTINFLRRLFGLPKFGFAGSSYKELYNLLKSEDIYTPQVFFERRYKDYKK